MAMAHAKAGRCSSWHWVSRPQSLRRFLTALGPQRAPALYRPLRAWEAEGDAEMRLFSVAQFRSCSAPQPPLVRDSALCGHEQRSCALCLLVAWGFGGASGHAPDNRGRLVSPMRSRLGRTIYKKACVAVTKRGVTAKAAHPILETFVTELNRFAKRHSFDTTMREDVDEAYETLSTLVPGIRRRFGTTAVVAQYARHYDGVVEVAAKTTTHEHI